MIASVGECPSTPKLDTLSLEAKQKGKVVVWAPRGRHGVASNGIVYVSVGRFSFGKDGSC